MAAGSRVAVVAALVANLLIAILKLAAGFLGKSSTMMAEAAHSFSDVGNQVLLLFGMSRAGKPPSEAHPYGTSKAAYFWPFMVAVLLFGVAGGYSALEGWKKIVHPHPLDDVRLAFLVLGAAFAIESVSMFVAVREAVKAARARGIGSVRQFLAENRDATLITVLVEDGLALVSLPIAAGAIALTLLTGNPIWDGIGSVVIGLLLMGFALFLAFEVHDLLIGKGLTGRDAATARRIIEADPVVERLIALQSLYLGPHAALLGVEVDVKDHLQAGEVEAAFARIEAALVAALPDLRFVYLEPRRAAPEPGLPSGPVSAGSGAR